MSEPDWNYISAKEAEQRIAELERELAELKTALLECGFVELSTPLSKQLSDMAQDRDNLRRQVKSERSIKEAEKKILLQEIAKNKQLERECDIKTDLNTARIQQLERELALKQTAWQGAYADEINRLTKERDELKRENGELTNATQRTGIHLTYGMEGQGSWKPNNQESKYLGVISNLAHDAQLGLFADRQTFGENVRAILKALDELPGTVPSEKKNEKGT